jgi:hypothetical protein
MERFSDGSKSSRRARKQTFSKYGIRASVFLRCEGLTRNTGKNTSATAAGEDDFGADARGSLVFPKLHNHVAHLRGVYSAK